MPEGPARGIQVGRRCEKSEVDAEAIDSTARNNIVVKLSGAEPPAEPR